MHCKYIVQTRLRDLAIGVGSYPHVGSEDGVVEIVGLADSGIAGANELRLL